MLALGLVAGPAATARAAGAETMGNPLISQPLNDGAASSLFVMTNAGFTAPGVLTTWGFFDNTAPTTFVITPVLFQLVGGNFKVTGIGTTRTNTGQGAQNFAFGLASGTAATDLGYYFGWRDGVAVASPSNQGVPNYAKGGVGLVTWFGGADAVVGSAPTVVQTYNRTYSLQGTSVLSAAVAPEPGSVGLLLAGALSLAGIVARRRLA